MMHGRRTQHDRSFYVDVKDLAWARAHSGGRAWIAPDRLSTLVPAAYEDAARAG